MKRLCLFGILVAAVGILCCEKAPTGVEPAQHIWNSSTPEAQGMDSQVLDSAFVHAESAGFVDGLLVIRNGFVVGEEYYNGYDEMTPHNNMSVSKSFLSAITGIAFQRGYVCSLDERVLDYFPEYARKGVDPRKYNITLRHLLTMRMGIRGRPRVITQSTCTFTVRTIG